MKATPPARISVIIPTYNEAAILPATLDAVAAGDAHEAIVVDGDSDDATVEIARARGAKVISATRGRGSQLNAGAAAATGDIYMFCHADTLLPAGYDQHVRDTLVGDGVAGGAFELSIDAPGRSLRVIERAVRWRSRAMQMPYGDQALFMRAAMFAEVGGFADQPVMEDYHLVRRLRRRGRIAIVPAAATTSARRWLERGTWRMTLINQGCVLAYHLGISPRRIARWRGGEGRGRAKGGSGAAVG